MHLQLDTLNFESIRVSDIAKLNDLQPQDWPDIIPKIMSYINHDFCYPIKLLFKSEIVGIGSVIVHDDVAWLGHIIVHQNHRKRGYGNLITKKLIEIAQSKGCKTIQLIATDMGAPIYASIGFTVATEYIFFKGQPLVSFSNNNANIINFNSKYKNEILMLDHSTSGETRVCEIEPHLSQGYVYQSENVITGFYLPTFGEGSIIATNPIAGLALLHVHLSTQAKIVLPKDNSSAIAFLKSKGFSAYATAKRMSFGTALTVKFENIYNRIAGNIG